MLAGFWESGQRRRWPRRIDALGVPQAPEPRIEDPHPHSGVCEACATAAFSTEADGYLDWMLSRRRTD